MKAAAQVNGSGSGSGASFDVTVGGVLRDIVLRYETIEYGPPYRVVVRASNRLLRPLDEIDVRSTADGSEILYTAALDFLGVWRPLNPLLGLVFKRIVERAADGLRDVVSRTKP